MINYCFTLCPRSSDFSLDKQYHNKNYYSIQMLYLLPLFFSVALAAPDQSHHAGWAQNQVLNVPTGTVDTPHIIT